MTSSPADEDVINALLVILSDGVAMSTAICAMATTLIV